MSVLKKIIFTILIIICGITIVYSLNYFILNDFIIGNPNSYDTDNVKTSSVFDFFYIISSDTGYRPEPSKMNFTITFLIGFGLGIFTSSKLIWSKKENAHTPNNVYKK